MQAYHCFLIDGNGRLADARCGDCADDEDAIRWAERMLRQNPDYRQAEVWQAHRLVAARQRSRDPALGAVSG